MMKQLVKNARSASIALFASTAIVLLAIFAVGCGGSDPVIPAVTSSFTATVNNTTGAVTFKNTSTNATIYLWDLGDGTTSAQFEPAKTYQTGTYTVKLTASNTAGGTATSENTFTVTLPGPPVDTTKPVITLIGDATINLTIGDPYTDKGATANDNLDGNITSKIVKAGTVNTAAAGTYTITYDVTDLAGNTATRVSRSVIVTAFDDGLLENGAFSIVNTQPGAAWSGNGFDVRNDGGSNYNFANPTVAGDAFAVNLSQVLPLTQGQNYVLKFEASSDRARTMVAGIGLNQDPWTNDTKVVNLTTAKQTFTLDLSAATFGGANSRVIFDMGAAVGTVVIDNVSLVLGPPPTTPTTPTTAAPTPPARAAGDVISIYGGAPYTTLTGIDYAPNWGQAVPVVVNTSFDPGNGNLALAYTNLTYQGTQFTSSVDASSMQFLHVDIWVASGTNRQVKVSPINNGAGGTGPSEVQVNIPLTPGAWNSVDLPKSSFTGMTWNAVQQMIFNGQFNGDGSANTTPFNIYLDNIYFYKTAGGGGGSTCPAPPTGEFIKDGGFEANAGCWELFATQAGTSSTIVTNVNNGGTNSARIKTAQAGNPGIKQTRLGAGVILPNTVYVVKFDVRQDATDQVASGAVFKVAAFSEGADGSGT
ncbi:MAG: immunoglobulin-like domain-containing protein, partial [Pseudomonadota bacterium]